MAEFDCLAVLTSFAALSTVRGFHMIAGAALVAGAAFEGITRVGATQSLYCIGTRR